MDALSCADAQTRCRGSRVWWWEDPVFPPQRLAWWVGEVEGVEETEEWKERSAAMGKSAGKEAVLIHQAMDVALISETLQLESLHFNQNTSS